MDVQYVLECLPEREPIEGNAMASGDDTADRECEQWIREQLDSGNEWAWCTVRVTARAEIQGIVFEGTDYLGCCSYESEDAFKAGGYYEQMCDEARADLLRNISAAIARGIAAKQLLGE